MPIILDTPEVQIQTITSVVVTSTFNDVENARFSISYAKLYEDGTPAERATFDVDGAADIKALYVELDVIIATGKSFEEASKELLYSKIAIGTLI